jgi:hypothetical protein
VKKAGETLPIRQGRTPLWWLGGGGLRSYNPSILSTTTSPIGEPKETFYLRITCCNVTATGKYLSIQWIESIHRTRQASEYAQTVGSLMLATRTYLK